MATLPPHRGVRHSLRRGDTFLVPLSWAALALFLLPSPAGARPIIIYPPDRTAVTTANINIYGAITERVEVVRLTINGQLMVPFVKSDRTFLQSARLRPGVNEIKVGDEAFLVAFATAKSPAPEGFRQRFLHPAMEQGCGNCHAFASPGDFSAKAPAREMCLGCHGDPSRGVGGAAQPFGHSPVSDDGDCLACHAPHVGDTRSMNVRPLPDLCYDCHDPVTKGLPRVHDPVGSGDCTACHGPHGAPAAKLLLKKGDELCLTCHDNPAKGLPVTHDGLGEGCSSCHAPHSSRYRGLLVSSERELCGECHDDIAVAKKGVKVHSPIADDGECTVCHRPHGSQLAKLLSAKPVELCPQCHDDVSSAGEKGGSLHPPAVEGGCPDCHSPHSGPSALLVKSGPELCLDCHDAFAKPDKGSLHAPVEEGACSDCHASHASPRRALLKIGGAELCYSCHDRFEGRVVHSPIADDDECSGCHLPHASANPSLLVKRGMPLCLECHEDPMRLKYQVLNASVHGPIKDDGNCLPCHTPHAGGKALLSAAVPALCERCHGDITRQGAGKKYGFVHTPVAGGACLDCHRAHASPERKLLAGGEESKALCLQCHKDPGKREDGSQWANPHPPVLQDCMICHVAHASNFEGNLVEQQFDLCRRCHREHPGHSLEGGRSISGQGTMVRLPEGFPLTEINQMVCRGCHLAHGSDYPHMLNTPSDWLCRRCHNF